MKSIIISMMALVGFSIPLLAATSKIAYLDMDKVIFSIEEGKKARETLETEFKKKKEDIEKERGAIQKLSQELEKQKLILSQKSLTKKQEEIQGKMMAYQRLLASYQQQLGLREGELLMPILEKIKGVVKEVAKNKGYEVVLEKNRSALVYAPEDFDLTAEIIKLCNQKKN